MNQPSSHLDSVLANLDFRHPDGSPQFSVGDHVATKSGTVHVVSGAWGSVAYSPCSLGSGVSKGSLTSDPVTCKVCSKRSQP